ncbi:protein kinase domain-containing protein [Corynebacterium sp. A21]|uniref:protein kinase domain-containing protein n=1 Tax=Corynebacterium sp. A21 TaxID=3457318 RepID=UPI003FD21621
MRKDSLRWVEISRSEYDHERAGLDALGKLIPDAAPYRLWTNFEFQDSQGTWNEVDALVLGRGRLHLLELKSWSGIIRGDEHNWNLTGKTGSVFNRKSPTLATRRKAQRLASKLQTAFQEIKAAADFPIPPRYLTPPIVKEGVLLHSNHFLSQLSADGQMNVFTLDHLTDVVNLPGITERILESPTYTEVDEDFGRIMMSSAIDKISGVINRKQRAGSWELLSKVDDSDDVVVWSARHVDHNEKALIKLRPIAPEATAADALRAEKAATREYKLLSSLAHPGIDSPKSLERVDKYDLPALVYPEHPGFEQLDLLLPGLKLTAAQQVEIILQIADAVAYAHRNNVIHRQLTPEAVLLNVIALQGANPRVEVKVTDWAQAVQVDAVQPQGTLLGTALQPMSTTAAYDAGVGFLPPEGYLAQADGRLADLFSVGALAYFILSGGVQPATTRAELIGLLKDHGGLDLGTTGTQVEPLMQALITKITSASPAVRHKAVLPVNPPRVTPSPVELFAGKLRELAQGRRATTEDDPLQTPIGELIDGRLEVLKVLGSGSTARGISVVDVNDESSTPRVLKMATSANKATTLVEEAQTLRALDKELSGHEHRNSFVTLLQELPGLPHSRHALLLSSCGDATLSDGLTLGIPTTDQFWGLGLQLLNILVALEGTGITHRDIKPANLGLSGKPSKLKLMLFDFSLSHSPLDNIDAGTPPYRDPFLGQCGRTIFDSHAERYSAAAVLYQMAMQESPRYAEDNTSADATDGRLLLSSEDLPAVWTAQQRELLSTLLSSALDGDIRRRPGSAEEMRTAFLAARKADKDQPDTTPVNIAHPTPAPQPASTTTAGITSLSMLIDDLLNRAGVKNSSGRRLVANILGTAESSPEDPFATNPTYSKILKVSVGRIPQLTGDIPALWGKTPLLATEFSRLKNALSNNLEALGGIATPEQLAGMVTDLYPDDAMTQTRRQQLGALRLVELGITRNRETDVSLSVVRRGRSQNVVALTSHVGLEDLPGALATAGRSLLDSAGRVVVPSAEFQEALLTAAAAFLNVNPSNLPVSRRALPGLAVHSSPDMALTPTGDLYSRHMNSVELLREVLPLADTRLVRRGVLTRGITSRFPAVHHQKLPSHPELDAVISAVDPDLRWDIQAAAYLRSAEDESAFTSLHTRVPTTTASDPHIRTPVAELAERLRESIAARMLRAVTVHVNDLESTASRIAQLFEVPKVSVAAAVLNELKILLESTGQGDKMTALLSLDTPETRGDIAPVIRRAAERAWPNILSTNADAIVLTDLSILADYGCLDLLRDHADVAQNVNRSAIWLFVPRPDKTVSSTSVEIFGVALPLSSPGQIIHH